jgi:Zn-dependent protease with chaperone function
LKFEARLPRDDVNVTARHPVREALVLLLGLALVAGVLLAVITLLVDRLIPHVPRSWEARLFPDFERLVYQPQNEEEESHLEQLESLLARLTAHWPDAPEGLRVGLLDAEEPNALAFPGGLVLVTRGLMREVESENEIAFVLGHELGHYRNRDHVRSLGRGLALAMIVAAVSRAGSGGNLVSFSGQLTQRSFSRGQEMEADAFGLSLLNAEFGHSDGATDFFERLPSPGNAVERFLASYLATHPLSDERIEALRELGAEIR